MTKLASMIAVSALGLSFAGCAGKTQAVHETAERTRTAPAVAAPAEDAGAPAPVLSGSLGSDMVQVRATVLAVDVKKRLVTLRGPKGNSETFEVSEEVRNLPQVKKGDQVIVEYYESAAYEVHRSADRAPGVSTAAAIERAKPGEKPAAAGTRTVTVTSMIEEIDKKHSVVTLKGPDGNLVDVRVKDPAKLAAVKVGDMVDISYTRAVAVKVETPAH